MRRNALILLVSMLIPAITLAGGCCDGFSFIGGLPLIERAYVTPPRAYNISATLPDAGFRTGDNGFDAGLLWSPSIGVGTGISSKFDISLSTALRPGGTIFGKYGIGAGPNAMAIGLKLSGNGFPVPGDLNPADTLTRTRRGQLYTSPMFMFDSKPGSLQYTFDVGPVFEHSQEKYGQGTSVYVGAEYDLFTKPLWTGGPIGAAYISGAWRLTTSDTYLKGYEPPASFTLGVSFEQTVHAGNK